MFIEKLKNNDFVEFLANFNMKDIQIVERKDDKARVKATLDYGDNSTNYFDVGDFYFNIDGTDSNDSEFSNQWKAFMRSKLPEEMKKDYSEQAKVGIKEFFKKITNAIKYDDNDALEILNRYFVTKKSAWLDGYELINRAYMDTEYSILLALTQCFNEFACPHWLSISTFDIYGNEHFYNIQILDEIKSIIICIPNTYMNPMQKDNERNFLQWIISNNKINQFEQINYIGNKIPLEELLTDYHIFYFKYTNEKYNDLFSADLYDIAKMNKRSSIKLDLEITKCLDSLDHVLNKPFSYFYQKYKSVYKEIVSNQFEEMEVLKNDKELHDKVINYIKSDKFNDDAIISFLTSIYVKNLFEENKRIDSLDYTSVSFGLYKMVEIVLNQIINDCWGDVVVHDDNNKTLYGNYKKQELGAMQFIYDRGIMPRLIKESNDTSYEVKLHLDKISKDIEAWRTNYRNGYCHKEAQPSKQFCEEIEQFAKEFIVEIIQYMLK